MPQFTGPLSYKIHSSKPTPYPTAQKWLLAYTSRSKTHPHMHPDAQLSRALSFGTHGSSGGVTISQLRKLARGLGGERCTPEPEGPPESNDKFLDEQAVAGKKRKADLTTDSEWEDAGVWAEKQGGVEVGEMGARNNFVAEVEEVPGVEEMPGKEVSKEERKRLKKEKRQREKSEREAKRRKGAEIEP